MANSDKNIVITPNIGQSSLPSISFTGQGNAPISLKVLDDAFGTLSFQNSSGQQLFSINNNVTTGSIFSVNDNSGLPTIEVNANGSIDLAPYGGAVRVHGHNYIESACYTPTAASVSSINSNNNDYIFFRINDNNYHYTTNSEVIRPEDGSGGGLRIGKRGVLHCMISLDLISSGNTSYVTMRIEVNGSVRGNHLITNTNGQWDGFTAYQAVQVAAGDQVQFRLSASDITSVDSGSWGHFSFLFHAV
jgi:hypothetical protein